MADLLITITVRDQETGDLIDADAPPTLRDPGGGYGLEVADTHEIILPVDTVIPRISLGLYQFNVEALVDGETYRYYPIVVVGGVPITYEKLKTVSEEGVDVPTHPWFTYAEFERYFGAENVKVASNKTRTSVSIDYDEVQSSFDYSYDDVNDTMRGGMVTVPLVFSGDVPKSFKRLVMWIAFGDLYSARGLGEKDAQGGKIDKMVKRCYDTLGMIRSGLRQIDLEVATATGESEPLSLGASVVTASDVAGDPFESMFNDEVFVWL
jgi:hypothetical protein